MRKKTFKIKNDTWEVFKLYLTNAIDFIKETQRIEGADYTNTTIIDQLNAIANYDIVDDVDI